MLCVFIRSIYAKLRLPVQDPFSKVLDLSSIRPDPPLAYLINQNSLIRTLFVAIDSTDSLYLLGLTTSTPRTL